MDYLLDVRNLEVDFAPETRSAPVVDGVDLRVGQGEVVGVIGESGSGKTVTCMALLRLLPQHAQVRADCARFRDMELIELGENEFDALRGRDLAMIFQDPVGSFNPVKTVGWHFRHVARRVTSKRPDLQGRGAWKASAVELLRKVGIPHGQQIIASYPHELSGGMLQRALIALVLQLRPALIVADEPTTNLDNIVEFQIIELFRLLRTETDASFLFITHDISLAARLCDRIVVMYAGQIVEDGSTRDVLDAPRHPYTQGLLRTATELEGKVDRLAEIPGELPTITNMPSGCRFAPRCPQRQAVCDQYQPMRTIAGERAVRCVLADSKGAL